MDLKTIRIIKLAEGLSKIQEIKESIDNLSTVQDLEDEIIKRLHELSAPNEPYEGHVSTCGDNVSTPHGGHDSSHSDNTSNIESLGFKTRTYNVLTDGSHSFRTLDKMSDDQLLGLGCGTVKRMRTIEDVLNFPKHGWVYLEGFGKSMAREVEEKMAAVGYPNFKITLDKGGYKHL